MTEDESVRSRDASLDELLKRLDAAAKGPEKTDLGDFMAAIILKGNRVKGRLDERSAGICQRRWRWGAEAEVAALMLAGIPFLAASIKTPAYLLGACAAGTVWAVCRPGFVSRVHADGGTD